MSKREDLASVEEKHNDEQRKLLEMFTGPIADSDVDWNNLLREQLKSNVKANQQLESRLLDPPRDYGDDRLGGEPASARNDLDGGELIEIEAVQTYVGRCIRRVNLELVTRIKDHVFEQLRLNEYANPDDVPPTSPLGDGEYRRNTSNLETLEDVGTSPSAVRLSSHDQGVPDAEPLPDNIRDLVQALEGLDVARRLISDEKPNRAIYTMFLATAFAMRGGAELLRQDEKSNAARNAGNTSGAQRTEQASTGSWPVYDEYLRRASEKHAGTKTLISKRAHRLLLKDCERFEQSQMSDDAATLALKKAAPGLVELLQAGWRPPKAWQTLDNRRKASRN